MASGVDLLGLQERASEAQKRTSDISAAAMVFPQQLKDAIMRHYEFNKDLIEQQSQARANFKTAPSEAREKYQDVFNPFTREKLVAQYRAQQGIPLDVATGLLDQRGANIADIIQSATPYANVAVEMQQGAAQAASDDFSRGLQLSQFRLAQEEASRDAASGGLTPAQQLVQKQQEEETSIMKEYVAALEGTADDKIRRQIFNVARANHPELTDQLLEQYYITTSSGAGGVISPKAVEQETSQSKLDSLNMSKFLVSEFERNIQGQGRFGGTWQKIKAKVTGDDPSVSTIESFRAAASGHVARGLLAEKGVLTDKDREVAMAILPTSSDTTEEVLLKLQRLKNMINVAENGMDIKSAFPELSVDIPDYMKLESTGNF